MTHVGDRIRELNPWFYPWTIAGETVVPGVGSSEETDVLADRTVYRTMQLVDAVVDRYDLRGKSVLDVGCNSGYWLAHYAKHGAARVVGLEGRQLFVDQAEFAWSQNAVLPRDHYHFVCGNVLGDEPWREIGARGPYDMTLCAGLLYHLPEYRPLLERIAEVTRELLVVDTRVTHDAEQVLPQKRDRFFNAIAEVPDKAVPNRARLLACLAELGFTCEVLTPAPGLPTKLVGMPDDYAAQRRITIVGRR